MCNLLCIKSAIHLPLLLLSRCVKEMWAFGIMGEGGGGGGGGGGTNFIVGYIHVMVVHVEVVHIEVVHIEVGL